MHRKGVRRVESRGVLDLLGCPDLTAVWELRTLCSSSFLVGRICLQVCLSENSLFREVGVIQEGLETREGLEHGRCGAVFKRSCHS